MPDALRAVSPRQNPRPRRAGRLRAKTSGGAGARPSWPSASVAARRRTNVRSECEPCQRRQLVEDAIRPAWRRSSRRRAPRLRATCGASGMVRYSGRLKAPRVREVLEGLLVEHPQEAPANLRPGRAVRDGGAAVGVGGGAGGWRRLVRGRDRAGGARGAEGLGAVPREGTRARSDLPPGPGGSATALGDRFYRKAKERIEARIGEPIEVLGWASRTGAMSAVISGQLARGSTWPAAARSVSARPCHGGT